ncbi:MAG: lytic murein transglycosylase [Desulfobacterales bacterium]
MISFFPKKSIQKATDYMRKYHADLLKAEIDYGVDKQVITAIMLVKPAWHLCGQPARSQHPVYHGGPGGQHCPGPVLQKIPEKTG